MKINIHLISDDIKLYNTFAEKDFFGSVTIGSKIEKTKYNYVLISDRIAPFNDLLDALNNGVLVADKIFYMLSNAYSNAQLSSFKNRLLTKNVYTIPPKLSEQQIFDYFCAEVNIDANSNKNVIAFFGADSKVGCTITAQAVAESLVENTSCSVALLCFGSKSFNYVSENIDNIGVDSIKPKVFSAVLTASELKDAMIQRGNLYILPSARIIQDFRHYHPKHAGFIIDLASKLFDVVIVDAGCDPNFGFYLGSLFSTSYRYMVTTQQESCRRAYELIRDQIYLPYGIEPESFTLIVNRYSGDLDNGQTFKLLLTNYGMSNAFILPNVAGVFWQTEVDKATLRHYKNVDYNRYLADLIKLISVQLNVNYNEQPKQKKGFRFFRSK